MSRPPDGRFEGRVAAVTGAASGIGAAIVRRFVSEGGRVVVADANAANGQAIVDELGDEHAVFEHVDVAAETDVERAVNTAVERFGHLDVMVNNAGVGGALGAVTQIHVEDWDYTFAVLVRGVFLGIKHAARQMVAQGGGTIVNTASIAGRSAGAGPLCYSSAKAAVVNLTRSAAVELAEQRIRVNAVSPGVTQTPLMDGGRSATGAILGRRTPWPDRLATPEQVAAAALFLASDDASYITGEEVTVDGGLTAAGPDLYRETGLMRLDRVGVNRGSTGLASMRRGEVSS
ncbi:MAG: glucose 1-dehydrogenase [Ilumatobacteraceae bacterium]